MFKNCGVGLFADTAYAAVKDGTAIGTAIAALKEYEEIRDVRAFDETFASLKDKMIATGLCRYSVHFRRGSACRRGHLQHNRDQS